MKIINKTMSRMDLFEEEAKPVIDALNDLLRQLYSRNLFVSSWIGSLPNITLWSRFFGTRQQNRFQNIGWEQRLNYQPLQDAVDDARIPWFLYWEIYWLLYNTKPFLRKGMRILDAGGASSLLSAYMASLGFEVHTVDLNKKLILNGNYIAKKMGWKMYSYEMNMKQLRFPDNYFDHAYSVCVFEHLDFDIKQKALLEIARCLKPGGILGISFDYRNPAPGVHGVGKDPRPINQLSSEDDLKRTFLSTGQFGLIGNNGFYDNGESYLIHPIYKKPYTFGSMFLRKVV
jgi:2-polyprenyl-3-methyl-5-hydroxy-6-metoxy-1,4-benzoquinol methylase